jgi:hypothetical protein
MGVGWRPGVLALLMAPLMAVAACSSIPIGTASKSGGLDALNEDVAAALLALDLPQVLEPVAGGSTLSLDITSASGGERHVRAVLGTADPGELAGLLPPPADGRSYYLFGLTPADQQAVREAQAWAKSLPPGNAQVTLGLSPSLCRTDAIDTQKTMVAALVALPGSGRVTPLLGPVPLASVLAAAPIKDVPACAGHSG